MAVSAQGVTNSLVLTFSVDESFTYDNGTVHYSLILTNQNISGANAATVDVTFNPPGPTGAAGAYGAPVTLDTAVNIPVGTTITYNWDGSGGALARSALAVDLGAIPLDSGATVAYALAGFNGQYNATPAYDAIDSRNVPVAVIHPSTITTISASAASVEVGGTVDLTVTEENDGDVDLTDPQVVVNDGTSDIATLVAPPTSGDDGDGVLEVGETWTWNATTVAALNDVVINADTTFTATGHGADPLDNDITYPGDADEQDAATVDVLTPSTITTISASATTVAPGGSVDLTVTEQNDGQVDLTSPQVVVNDGTSDIATLVAPPTSGDDGDGVLEVGETWTWNATTVAALNDVVINATTTFTATGSGTDSLDNVITYPGDPDERDAVTVDVEVVGNEGCTPGYWKNSPDCWECYTTGTKFSAVFGRQIKIFTGGNPKQSSNYITDPTLLQALGANGGGINALARDAVAALLNACDEDINYPLSVAGVIAAVQAAIDGGAATIESEHLLLDLYNNYGCPQDAHCNPIIPEEDLI
jgi:hypothetical protein